MLLQKQSVGIALRSALPSLCMALLLLANPASAVPITIIMESDVSTSPDPDPGSSGPEIKTQIWAPPSDVEYKLKPEPTSITFRGVGDTENVQANGSDGYFLLFDYAEITLNPFGEPEPASELTDETSASTTTSSTPKTLEFTSRLAIFTTSAGMNSSAALNILLEDDDDVIKVDDPTTSADEKITVGDVKANTSLIDGVTEIAGALYLELYSAPQSSFFDGWDITTPLSVSGNGVLTPSWGESGEVVQVKNPIGDIAPGDIAGLYFEPQGTAGDDVVPLPVTFIARVPTPGTLALLLLGVSALVLRRTRQK